MASFPAKDSKEEGYEETYQKHKDLVESLPKGKGWRVKHIYLYQGYWFCAGALLGGLLVQNHFHPQPTDIILAAFMKSGTTWLRALIFSIMKRSVHNNFSDHPLHRTGPQGVFPFLDAYISTEYPIANLDDLPPPRLFGTHLPHSMFPIGCKFVYVCRDPKDVVISKWHFMSKLRDKELPPLSLEDAFEQFCQGVSEYGPYWDHVLGYWRASLEWPEKILFLKYEDLKMDPVGEVKKLAEFLGKPFSEEESGVAEEIVKLCSFENLAKLDVNKSGVVKFRKDAVVENREFFRKGVIGDWVNYLSDEMKQRLDRITEEKLKGTGLVLGHPGVLN